MNISVVIPVFHEEKNVEKVLVKLAKSIENSHEIIIVYDTTFDPTVHVVRNYIHVHKAKNIQLVKNKVGTKTGVMNAIKTGFLRANGEAIVVLMADLSDDTLKIDAMYDLIQKGYDIVCASRFMKGGRKIGGALLKTILSKAAGLSLYYFLHFPTHDATNAFKMYKKNVFKNIRIESKGGFEYSLEILVKAYKKGYKITEIPTIWKDRTAGKSNFHLLSWLPQYIRWYLYAFKGF